MPSKALRKFEGAMMRDVDRMIDTHAEQDGGTPGKKGLGHLTRAGVLLLCAAWELYIEEVLVEGVECSIDRGKGPKELPTSVQKEIAKYVRKTNHELKVLEMAGNGWKAIYREVAKEWVERHHSPKAHKIDEGFTKLIGLDGLSGKWNCGPDTIDRFVEVRGDIAHRGTDAENVYMNQLRDSYKVQLMRCAEESFVRTAFEPHSYPWNRRNLEK